MTKSEREDLQRLVRQREKALKSAAAQRSAELLADFEQQLASVYHYDQQEIWAKAFSAAKAAAQDAVTTIASHCEALGIPAQFAPSLELYWTGRGQNAVAQRRDELRRVAKTRIAAIEKEACVKIELHSVDMQTRIIAFGLTSAAATEFLKSMPAVDALMPTLEFAKIQGMLESRRGRDA
jgi:predicted component of type VI protein secretion system